MVNNNGKKEEKREKSRAADRTPHTSGTQIIMYTYIDILKHVVCVYTTICVRNVLEIVEKEQKRKK